VGLDDAADAWAELLEAHLQPVLELESRDRDDVFRKAFRKNRDDFLDGLLLMEGKSGFGSGRFSHHAQDKQKEQEEPDLEVIDEELNHALDAQELEAGEPDEQVQAAPADAERPPRRFSGEVTIARVANDLDHSEEEDEEGLEEHEKELSQQQQPEPQEPAEDGSA
jgi:hypothetical protein